MAHYGLYLFVTVEVKESELVILCASYSYLLIVTYY